MPAETDFINNPVAFMQENILRPVIHGFKDSIQNFKFEKDEDMIVRKGKFHWYNKKLSFYKVVRDDAGPIRAYVLGFKENEAVGSILGVAAGDPRFMFTYRMDGCSLGFAQASPAAAAYVSHHNDKTGGNVPATIAGQAVNFADGAAPALNFAHKASYQTDSKGDLNAFYKSTTVGVRDATNVWRFYLQQRKYHGMNTPDKNLSLKDVILINP